MVRIAQIKDTVAIPEGVETTVSDIGVVSVKSGKIKLEKDFSRTGVSITKEGDHFAIEAHFLRKKEAAIFGTVKSMLKNMLLGVTKGFIYKSKIVYSHFPITVTVEKDKIKVESLYGGRKPLYTPILAGVKVKVDGDDVVFTGADREQVGQTAANLQEICKLRGKRRKATKTFMDGIWMFSKGIQEEA